MKILHLISSAGQYGAENMLLDLATSVAKFGCTAVIGVFENKHNLNIEILESAQKRGLPAVGISCSGRMDLKTIRQIEAYIREYQIELIHSHGYKSNLYGYWAARRMGIPIVATCHGWPGRSVKLRLFYWLDRIILRQFDHIVLVSKQLAEPLQRSAHSRSRISQVNNGVEVMKFRNATKPRESFESSARVGFAGRLAPEKGLSFFLRAAERILKEFPDTEFVLVGEGPERKALEFLTKTLKIEDKVIFAGIRRDMPAVYASLDIFVLPSLSEGMPLVLLEAMAAAKPVVASRVGGIPDVIISGENGLLVEPESIVDLQEAILQYLRDRAFARKIGLKAVESIQCAFSVQTMASNYFEIYQRLLHGPQTNRALSPQEV